MILCRLLGRLKPLYYYYYYYYYRFGGSSLLILEPPHSRASSFSSLQKDHDNNAEARASCSCTF
jgi:hypothetical protein